MNDQANYCSRCGTKAHESGAFCHDCGKPLVASKPTPHEQDSPIQPQKTKNTLQWNSPLQKTRSGTPPLPTSSQQKEAGTKFFSKKWVWVLTALGAVAPLANYSEMSTTAQDFIVVDMAMGALIFLGIAFVIHKIANR